MKKIPDAKSKIAKYANIKSISPPKNQNKRKEAINECA